MVILSIETSASACSVALLKNKQVFQRHIVAPMQQAQMILPLIKALLDEANVSKDELNAIAFGRGPGSFTGVRIATSIAQGLGYGLDIPLIAISSLAIVAQTAYADLGWTKLLVAMDARIQEVYWARYEVNSQGIVQLQGEESVCFPQQLRTNNIDKDALNSYAGIGTGWAIYENEIIKRLGFKPTLIDSQLIPNAAASLMIAKIKYEQNECITAAEALPVYLRDRVANKSAKA